SLLPQPLPARRRGLLVAATVGGALLLFFGALCLLLYLAWPLLEDRPAAQPLSPDEAISQAAEFAVLGVSWLGIGGALLWQAVRAWQGQPARWFRPGLLGGLLALAVFPLALAAGI